MGGGTVSADVKKGLILVCAALVMLVTAAVELPAGFREAGTVVLSRAGQRSLAVLLFTLILWLTEAVPFHVTGLLGVFFLAVLKVGSFSEIVAAGFGNDIVVFFIGVLTLSTFITKAGLGNRISVFLLSKTGNRTSTILRIPLTLLAAMLMPLAVAVLREEGLKPLESRFGKALMISTAWGPIIGGIMAPSGAGPNPLAIGFLKEMAGIEVSFIEWMSYGVPAGLMLLFPTWLVLLLFFRPEITHLKKSREELKAEYRELAKMDREEKVTTVLFVLTVLLWLVTPLLERMLGIGIPISMPVLLSSSLFFFPKGSRISWREVEREIPWSSILLIVSGISIGMFLFRSGAAEWLAVSVLGGIGSAGPFVRVFFIPEDHLQQQHGDGDDHQSPDDHPRDEPRDRAAVDCHAGCPDDKHGLHPGYLKSHERHSLLDRLLHDQGHGSFRRSHHRHRQLPCVDSDLSGRFSEGDLLKRGGSRLLNTAGHPTRVVWKGRVRPSAAVPFSMMPVSITRNDGLRKIDRGEDMTKVNRSEITDRLNLCIQNNSIRKSETG